MFAVPEVDDDIDVSTPINTTKPITQPEGTKESFPLTSPPPSSTVPSVGKVDQSSTKMQVPPPPPPPPSQSSLPPVSSKQHRSRRSLFHRNTIHVCDQIADRV